MSFWREEDDDEIWKELLYWLENPVTAEENWQKKSEKEPSTV